MRQLRRTIISLLITFVLGAVASRTARAENGVREQYHLRTCKEQVFGFRVLCNPAWPREEGEDFLLRYSIHQGPETSAQVTFTESMESGLEFGDLTPEALQYVFEYAPQFRYVRTRIGRRQALHVEAKQLQDPATQLLDFFLIHRTRLFRISFAVSPVSEFVTYRELFEEMAHSFAFREAGEETLP